MDDYCPKRGFHGEHGLSLHVETSGGRVLFDTGQGGAFLRNARTLGIDLSGIHAVVLSHGHYDHGGGLPELYSGLPQPHPELFAGRGFDRPRKARSAMGLVDIGLSQLPGDIPPATIVDVPVEIGGGIHAMPCAELADGSSPLPRFRRLEAGAELLDEFEDELSLVVAGGDGIAVLTGCAHRGILNIAEAARRAFPALPIKALIGGFHLADCPTETLDRVARGIAALDPAAVLCSHCTGPRGFASLAGALGARVAWLSCGMSISL